MIVKDEAPIIERCLESVLPIVDDYVICDTGSRDGTPDIVRAFFERGGISGSVHTIEFGDFASARNRALDLCRAAAKPFDYILLTDADMELRLDRADLRQRLTDPAYALRQTNRISYYNTRLIRREVEAHYVGVTHEYLHVAAPVTRLEAAWFADHACGSSREEKSARDVRLLLAGLSREPGNARYMFYLAQTYKDAGRLEEAIDWYTRRIAAGGWAEELWYATYVRALCHLQRGEVAAFVQGCLDAYNARPTRAEPLHALAKFYREHGQNEACLLMCEAGERIPYPTDDVLFIEDEVYGTGFGEEASIAGFYCGTPERQITGREACLALATNCAASTATRNTARRNAMFYARSAAELFGSCAVKEIRIDAGEELRAINPSICRHQGRVYGIIRVVNYALVGRDYKVLGTDSVIRTENLCANFDDAYNLVSVRPMLDRTLADGPVLAGGEKSSWSPPTSSNPTMTVPRYPVSVRGFEDCRLFSWRGRLWCSATARDTNPDLRCELVVLELDDALDIVAMHINRSIHPERHQKNWVPLVTGNDLYFVYSTDRTLIVRFDPDAPDSASQGFTTIRSDVPALALDHCRGGSQAVAFEDGWLYLVHEVIDQPPQPRAYLHRFVKLNRDLCVVAVSEPFFFVEKGVEFATGLIFDALRNELVVSLGVMDAKAVIAVLDSNSLIRHLVTCSPTPACSLAEP